jgi:hypothetical protein
MRTRQRANGAPERETRAFAIRDLEVRAARDDDGAIPMSGYAAVFNSRSHVLWDWWEGSFVEEIEPGAFAKTIQESDVRLLINHDPNLVLGRTRSETLSLTEDDTGLLVDAEMGPTSYAQDLAVSMQRGDVSQMSFAFRVIKDDWSETEEGLPLRRLLELHLFDVSVVTFPAYEETSAGLRSRQFESPQDMESWLERLIQQEITPASLPVLRAARTALEARLAEAEPPAQHSADLDWWDRRHRSVAALHGLEIGVEA